MYFWPSIAVFFPPFASLDPPMEGFQAALQRGVFGSSK